MANKRRIQAVLCLCWLVIPVLRSSRGKEPGPKWVELSEDVVFNSSSPIQVLPGTIIEVDVPNARILLIWEHSCIQHLQAGRMLRARQVRETMDWQRATKKGLTWTDASGGRETEELRRRYFEALEAKERMGDQFVCNPPPARFELTQLKVGKSPSSNSLPAKTFLTDRADAVAVEAAAKILGDCKACRIDWSFSFSGKGKENVHFENQSHVQYTHSLLPALRGDRGGDFKLAVKAVLLEEGREVDRMDYKIGQDEIDQLRQEYVDMWKKRIPNREELTDRGDTAHFTINEFNKSEKVDGGRYEYILSKVLDKLERVRSGVKNIPLLINSGFRNPFKNAKIPGSAKESRHLYGLAVDIRLQDFNGDERTNDKDRNVIFKAAKAVGACVEPKDKKGRVHVDWRSTCPKGW